MINVTVFVAFIFFQEFAICDIIGYVSLRNESKYNRMLSLSKKAPKLLYDGYVQKMDNSNDAEMPAPAYNYSTKPRLFVLKVCDMIVKVYKQEYNKKKTMQFLCGS